MSSVVQPQEPAGRPTEPRHEGSVSRSLRTPATLMVTALVWLCSSMAVGEGDPRFPELLSFTRQTPGAQDTNADSLVFRATFDEDVQHVTGNDFAVTGSTATVTGVNAVSASVYDLTVSGGNLAGYDGAVGLNLSGTQNIADLWDNPLPAGEPATDETYLLDNTPPTDPTPASSSHAVSVWSNDDTVDIQISGASDGSGSGIYGFETGWDQSATWISSQARNQVSTWTGGTFVATSDGDWYFHIATVDNVGNWTSTEHLGPFWIDTTPPSVPTGLTPPDGTCLADTSPTLSWDASTDSGGSGVRTTAAYRVVVTGTPSRDYYADNTSYTPTLAEGMFTWRLYARDNAGNNSEWSTEYSFYIDETPPNVTLNQAAGQPDPTSSSPVEFTAEFDEPIDAATFTSADVTVGGTATTGAVTVTEIGPSDHTTFSVSVVVTGDGTVTASIPASVVEDLAGNTNAASTSTDNTITYDASKPCVTIDQAVGQSDPTNASPVLFPVEFSEPIDQATFTAADVNVGGTATTGTVTITEITPNDGTAFLVSIVVTTDGTVLPTIPAGCVEDLVGNTNEASTSTDNVVTFETIAPHATGVTVSSPMLTASDVGPSAFTVTVDFDEPMDPGTAPTIAFTPDVSSTLSLASVSWLDANTYRATYAVADSDVFELDVAISVDAARDLAGNAQLAYDAGSQFGIDTATALPGTGLIVRPAGTAPADGAFLDRCLPLEEGEDPPIIMGRRLEAIYTIGEPIAGGCMLTDADGEPLCGLIIIAELYRLCVDVFPPEYERVSSEFVRYSATSGCYAYWILTEGLEPGYYDVRLAFPNSTQERLRIQLVEPED
jgi:hypothetical protein